MEERDSEIVDIRKRIDDLPNLMNCIHKENYQVILITYTNTPFTTREGDCYRYWT